MIDVETVIISGIIAALETKDPSIECATEYVPDPTKFPHVSIEEADNYGYVRGEDSSGIEKYANVMYEVNVHTKGVSDKKLKAKEILGIIDDLFIEWGFIRVMKNAQTIDNGTICRLIARYSAVVSKNNICYRR